MARNTYTDLLRRATDGLVGTITDFVLLNLYLFLSAGSIKTMGDANRVVEEVHAMLDAVNYQTIKKALSNLSARGLIADQKTLAITKLGKERIAEMVPAYKTDRPWDGHIYLISYDIPRKHNRSRDLLREYIRRTGGALLQESLWINPYNPSLLLAEFVDDHHIPGTVLVSKLGSDGAIGDESLPDLIARVYQLDELARRYEEFLQTHRRPAATPKTKIFIDYLAILKDDPQIPFPLLPKGFPAEAAWRRYRSLVRS